MNSTPISIRDDVLLMSTGLTQPPHPPQHHVNEGGRRVKKPTVWDSGISCVVGLDGSRGKFGWSEGDVLKIVKKNGFLNDLL